jgi:hypothetical protein
MRQLPSLELHNRRSGLRRNASAVGASAFALGASSTLFAGKAGSEPIDAVSTTIPPHVPEEAGPAAEPVLIATFAGVPATLLTPAANALPGPIIDTTSGAVIDGPALAMSPADAPSFVPLPQLGLAAVSLIGNVTEVAQAPQAEQEATDSGSYWPEGHWADDRASDGFLGTALGVGGGLGFTALLAAGGWYAWQYVYGKPSFDHALVYLKFDEGLCGDPVYTAPGKGRELEYSIIENPLDDSSLVEIDAVTGEITFVDDPQAESPGDLDRDGIYHFVVEVKDGNSNTATQVVELMIQNSSGTAFEQKSTFLQHGASVCADDVRVTAAASGQSIEDISTGRGNDYVKVESSSLTTAGQTVGIELGSGGDTLEIWNTDPNDLVANGISVDVGPGRDTIVLKADVLSLEIENFDEDDQLNLEDYLKELTLVAPVVKDGSNTETNTEFTNSAAVQIATATPGQNVQLYSDEADALNAIYKSDTPETGRFAFYQNGEDTFMVIETNETQSATDRIPETTIKFEDLVLADYSQIEFA